MNPPSLSNRLSRSALHCGVALASYPRTHPRDVHSFDIHLAIATLFVISKCHTRHQARAAAAVITSVKTQPSCSFLVVSASQSMFLFLAHLQSLARSGSMCMLPQSCQATQPAASPPCPAHSSLSSTAYAMRTTPRQPSDRENG